jgi:ABC-type phosphate transport system substrate-binding protein
VVVVGSCAEGSTAPPCPRTSVLGFIYIREHQQTMKLRTKKVSMLALAATASMAVAGIGAGTSQASLLTACTGSNITGEGSSLQRTAQGVWTPDFNTNTNGGCTVTGRKPAVTYNTSSSGTFLNKWDANGTTTFDTTVDFGGSDDAPTTTQLSNINGNLGTGRTLSIPVAQAAIAIIVNPPSGCTVFSITPAELEKVFRGNITSWGGLSSSETSGCTTSQPITRVVRADSSGTSYQLKHYLFNQNSAAVCASPSTKTWADLQAAADNTNWPTACDGTGVTKSESGCPSSCGSPGSGSGGGDEAKTVKAITGSIGYAALADARGQYTGTGQYSWIPVGTVASPIDPSSNGLSTTAAQSNCTTASSAYGTLPAATASWSGVYLTTPGTTGYPICTLTWDIAVTDYSSKWGTSGKGIATSVHDYLNYILTTAGGVSDALNPGRKDYQKLPTDVQTAAQTGISQITD